MDDNLSRADGWQWACFTHSLFTHMQCQEGLLEEASEARLWLSSIFSWEHLFIPGVSIALPTQMMLLLLLSWQQKHNRLKHRSCGISSVLFRDCS